MRPEVSALPSIIGPASVLLRPQKSHNTAGCAGYELPSVVTLFTPHRHHGANRDAASGPKQAPMIFSNGSGFEGGEKFPYLFIDSGRLGQEIAT